MPRLFVAVLPPDEVLDLLDALPRVDEPGVRWTTREQWHVTLRFLGETAADPAISALHGAVPLPPAVATLGPRIGRLGSEVLIAPVDGLGGLADAVRTATASLGRPPDDRPFLGHVTLARLRRRASCGLVRAPLRATWTVREVALVESGLHPDGARYRHVAHFPVG